MGLEEADLFVAHNLLQCVKINLMDTTSISKFRKEIIWGIVLVVLIIVAGFILQKNNILLVNKNGVTASSTEPMFNGVPLKDVYTKEVPQGATLTDAQTVIPASANKALTTSARTIVMKATQDGFNPSTVTVNQWDRIELAFSPQDGDYDFSIPYLGTYFYTVKKGEQTKMAFELPTSGTFSFECLYACPTSGKIKGEIVVLPKNARQ